MKNKRNTRRGRAKRWTFDGRHWVMLGMRRRVWIRPPWVIRRLWSVFFRPTGAHVNEVSYVRSRAAAMRAAESMARFHRRAARA